LQAVSPPSGAVGPGAPPARAEREDSGGSVWWRWVFSRGDAGAAAAGAAVIVEGAYSSPLSAPAPIETHCCLASFDSEGRLDVWTGVHMAFMYRKAIADCLRLDWRDIRVHQPPIGGSF